MTETSIQSTHDSSGRRRSSFMRNLFSASLNVLVAGAVIATVWWVARQTHFASGFTQQVERRLGRAWVALNTPVEVDAEIKDQLKVAKPIADQVPTLSDNSGSFAVDSFDSIQSTSVEVLVLKESTNPMSRSFSGVLKASQSSDLGFNRTGMVRVVHVDQGDHIKKGDVLIELDNTQLEADIAVLVAQRNGEEARLNELLAGPRPQTIAAAKSTLKELEALRDQAQITSERQAKLLRENAIAQQDVDDSVQLLEARQNRVDSQRQLVEELEAGTRKEQLQAQRALIRQLDAQIASIQVKIDESRLSAPFDGLVSARNVDEGAIVLPGSIVLRLVETRSPEAWIGLPLEMVDHLHPESEYVLRSKQQRWNAKFRTLLPELDQATRTQTAIFDLVKNKPDTNSNARQFALGQMVRLELPLQQQQGLWIPQSALTQNSEGKWAVFVVVGNPAENGTQTIQRRLVEVQSIDSDQVLIQGELRAGATVVVRGIQKLTPGQHVRPVYIQ